MKFTDDEIRRVLIVRMSALGDVAHTLPALSALRERFPAAEIDWLVEPMGAALLADHPSLARIQTVPRPRWKRRWRRPWLWPSIAVELARLASVLREREYDLVIDFQGNVRSAVALMLSGGRYRLGFHRADRREAGTGLPLTHSGERTPARISRVEKNLSLVRKLGYTGPCPTGEVPHREEDLDWARSVVERLPGSGPAVVVHPPVSRFGEIKRWPVEHFRALIDQLHELPARTLLTWGPGEEELCRSIDRPTVLGELIDLRRFAALLRAADLVVAADTGALPIAAMCGTPTVGLYGPKDPAVFAPYPRRGEVVTSSAPCSPCTLRRCEHRICMTLISPKQVFAAVSRALGREE